MIGLHRNRHVNENDLCYICYARPSTITHGSCRGKFWNDCIENWAITSIKARNLDGQDPVPWLQNSCQDGICYTELQSCLSTESLNRINETYNENYFTKTQDISRCPKENCNSAGFIKLGACRDNIQCGKCMFEWRDHAHLTVCEKTSKAIRNTLSLNPESFNYLNKVLWSIPCPQCGMFIQKDQGCAHMVWQYCKYEFCWIWLGHYPGYVHRNGDICGVRKFMSVGFTLIALLMMFIYMLYSNTYASFAVKFASKTFGKWLVANLAALSILLNLGFSLSYAEKVRYGYYNSGWDRFCVYFLAVLIVVWPMIWSSGMYFAYYSENFSFLPMWPIYELCLVLAVILVILALFLGACACYFLVFLPSIWICKQIGKAFYKGKVKISKLLTNKKKQK